VSGAPLRVLVAPDKFKGSLTAAEVAEAVARGLAAAGVPSRLLPLADGGDGSVLAAVAAGFRPVTVQLHDGRTAEIAVDDSSHTAVVEVANTCGLFTTEMRNAPCDRSTQALGEAVRQALRLATRRVVLALGGSSTTDGGIGFLHALGARFFDGRGEQLAPLARNLARVARIDVTRLELGDVDLVLATDVDNPLTGPRGCAVVFGPQKGLPAQDVARVDGELHRLVDVAAESVWPRAAELAEAPGAGAAGGLGWAGMLLGGQRTSGATYFLDLLRFDAAVNEATHVVTGEGRLDDQTAEGKLPQVVASRAAGRPVIAITGRCDVAAAAWPGLGLRDVRSVSDIAGRDTSTDPELTRRVLTDIGHDLGEQLQSEPS
jgi:glycerate 2-kinase